MGNVLTSTGSILSGVNLQQQTVFKDNELPNENGIMVETSGKMLTSRDIYLNPQKCNPTKSINK
jgi:hypothetical protein